MIELLVAIGVVGVLTGLLLPAVQSAREAARRSQCASRLHELIVATHAFESAHGEFPRAFWGLSVSPLNHASLHCILLPYLEQGPLFHGLSFHGQCHTQGELPLDDTSLGVNATVARAMVEVFLCPSDPLGRSGGWPYGPNSYRASLGSGELRYNAATAAWDSTEDGAFVLGKRGVPLASFRDGLSNTLAFSEKPVGTGPGTGYEPFRDWVVHIGPTTVDGWVRDCSSLSGPVPARFDAGRSWVLAGPVYTCFFTKLPPNSTVPDCGHNGTSGQGVFNARSYHQGGVNAAIADGSVRFYRTETYVQVWRALGTRITVQP